MHILHFKKYDCNSWKKQLIPHCWKEPYLDYHIHELQELTIAATIALVIGTLIETVQRNIKLQGKVGLELVKDFITNLPQSLVKHLRFTVEFSCET